MGCYNLVQIEARKPDGEWKQCDTFPEGAYLADELPFNYQDYEMYALVANVRNFYHEIIPLDNIRGLPLDVSEEIKELYYGVENEKPEGFVGFGWEPRSEPLIDRGRWGTPTHFTIQELLDYPHYDRELVSTPDRPVEPGTTLRMELKPHFFTTLEAFKNWSEYTPDNVRVIMSFD
ncbi:hypothetical protein [Yersinia ruckeri]|uniref:hypothetical protein n=1 Tax=Yersinia ruckeri TaxID=29486 RepID=UPI002237FDE9|nr:hypothetical protein [Yersinia ruckeri]MCW6598890.1 hypothetical protein [Yersinia ruckeri]